ncbi:MAG: O-antigen polymerase [Eubacteriales bacterium]|nr:O-antigen polymerase [Eubacteriales bacterium]
MRVSRYSIYEVILFHFFVLVYYLTFSHKDMWGSTIALLGITIVLILLEYLRTKLFVSPLLLWYVFWLGVISVGRMDLNLYPFYQTWSRELLNVVILNTVIFFWFFWAGEFLNLKVSSMRKDRLPLMNRGDLLAGITLCILIVSATAFFINVIYTGYIPQLTGDANSYRQSFVVTPFYRIVNLFRFVFAIVPFAFIYTRQRIFKIGIVLFSLILMGMEMLSGWRSYTLQAMVLLLTSLFLVLDVGNRERKRSAKKTLPIIAAAVSAALVFIGYVAVTRDGVIGAFKEKFNYLLYTLDMYIAPNFLNFQSGMNSIEPLGYPLYTTEAFWGLVTSWDELPPYPPIDQAIGAFNVSTYLLQPYVDLGIPGTLIWSGVAGITAGSIFRKCRERLNSGSVILLGIVNFSVLVMHNNFFFRASSTVLWIAAGAAIDLFILMSGIRRQRVMKG